MFSLDTSGFLHYNMTENCQKWNKAINFQQYLSYINVVSGKVRGIEVLRLKRLKGSN